MSDLISRSALLEAGGAKKINEAVDDVLIGLMTDLHVIKKENE